MKKVIVLLISVFVFVGFVFGQEVLLNGTFESWDDPNTPTSWTHVENITQESTIVHGGTYSAQHIGGTKDIGQTIVVEPNTNYTIVIWYYVEAGDGSDARIWSFFQDVDDVRLADIPALLGPDNSYLPSDTSWQKYETIVTSPADAASLYFEVRTYSTATVYWDDMSVFHTVTDDPEPTNHVNGFTVTANGHDQIDLTWAETDGTQAPAGYLIKASTSDNITNPTDSTAVSDNSTIGSNSGAKNISHGTTSYEWTELNAETQYYFKIYPHTNSGTDIDYKTTATVPNGNATTEKTPPASAVYISEVSDAPSDYHNEFMEIYNDNSSIYNLSNSKIIRYNSSGGFDDYVFDFATEGSGNTEIPANGFIVIARGSSKSNFETEWGNLPAGANYNEGTDELYLGTGRQWAVKDGGTADTDDGTEIDATNQVVADDDRDYQQPIGTWVNATDVTATPGEFDNDQSLPVTLLNFNANFKNGEIVLNWTTTSESDNLGYKIYRKSDDEDAKLLSSYVDNDDLKGQGNSSERTNYKYTDLNVKTGVNYTYILKDVDFSGKETKSGEVNITTAENNLTVTDKYTLGNTYPNPFNPTFTIPLQLNENAFVNIQLVNILGQKVLQIENSQMAVGNNDLQVNCENLNSGVYFVKVTVDLSSADRVNNIQKVVLLK